jgi:hypothetical protein
MRTGQEIGQLARRKRCSERQQNLCNQPERAQLPETPKRQVPVASGYTVNRQIQPPEGAYSKERPLARAAAGFTIGPFLARKAGRFQRFAPARPAFRGRHYCEAMTSGMTFLLLVEAGGTGAER